MEQVPIAIMRRVRPSMEVSQWLRQSSFTPPAHGHPLIMGADERVWGAGCGA